MSKPLSGVRVVELAGIGPAPHACMMLADLGAEVVRVEAPSAEGVSSEGTLRGRTIVHADLKLEADRELVLSLIEGADVLVEGFRPGVAERLGLGPEVCAERNSRLIYGRMTGWGQEGDRAQQAGHDLTYIALTGVLDSIRARDGKPVPPSNVVGDFGGGSMFLVVGVLAALVERAQSGRGQVVDAAIVDGVSVLTQMMWDFKKLGLWGLKPEENPLSGDIPFYDTYLCADGKYVAIAPIESKFYAAFLDGLGLNAAELPAQWDRDGWPELRRVFSEKLAQRSRDSWTEAFQGLDACVVPVLSREEALHDPHMIAREMFTQVDGGTLVTPAPRFSRTSTATPPPLPKVAVELSGVVAEWLKQKEYAQL